MKKIVISMLILVISLTLLFAIIPKVSASEVIERPSLNDTTESVLGDNYIRLPIYDLYISDLYNFSTDENFKLYLRFIELEYSVRYNEDEEVPTYQYRFTRCIVGYAILTENKELVQDLTLYATPTIELPLWFDSLITKDMLLNGQPISNNIPTYKIDMSTTLNFETDLSLVASIRINTTDGESIASLLTASLITEAVGEFIYYADLQYQLTDIMPNVTSLYYFRDYAYKYANNQNLVTTPHFTDWVGTAVGGFLDMELIPGLSLGLIMWLIIAVAVLIIILKMFAGG